MDQNIIVLFYRAYNNYLYNVEVANNTNGL